MQLFSRHNQEFHKIVDLAMSDDLLIFVGAGCSIEAGLPDWKRLISRYINLALLIQSEIELTTESRNRRNAIPHEFLENFASPGHIAVIADAIVGAHRRHEILSLALYPEPQPPKPGPTAKEIAKLYRERFKAGLKTRIVTTNYDPLLEIALEKYVCEVLPRQMGPVSGFGLDDASLDDDSDKSIEEAIEEAIEEGFAQTEKKHEPKVFHLHGAVDFRNRDGGITPILLTEADYAKSQHLAQMLLEGMLKDSNCLMVGLSLEDNDVLTALYSAMARQAKEEEEEEKEGDALQPLKGSRYVLAFNEVSYEGADPDDDEPMIKQLKQLEAQRLQMLGVRPMKHLKNFAQIPQVIHEMGVAVDLLREKAARRKKKPEKQSSLYWESKSKYGERLDAWQKAFKGHYELDADTKLGQGKFAELQRNVSQELQLTLEEIMMNSIELTSIADELAIHIWARSYLHDRLELFLWAGNEYAQQRSVPSSLSRRVERSVYDIPLRQAFEGVSSRRLLPASKHSRWAQVMGVPIISKTTGAKHRYGRLLVGVVTLSTNLPPEESDLSDSLEERSDLVGQIEEGLEAVGQELLINRLV